MALHTVTQDNFDTVVMQASQPVLVEFSAPWCVYCRRIAPVMTRLADKLDGQVDIAMIDIDEQPDLAERFAVETIPALMLFRGGESVREPLIAPASQAQIETWMAD